MKLNNCKRVLDHRMRTKVIPFIFTTQGLVMKVLCLIALLLVQNVFAEEVIQSFKVNKANPNIQKIADLFEVKDQLKESFLVYVLKEKVSQFKTLAPKATIVSLDINADIKDKNLQGYHKFDEVKELYYEFAKNHSDVAKIEVFGQSAKGHELFALKVSDNVHADENEPRLMITSATHGDELITVEVQLRLVNELLEGASTNPRLKRMIDDHELYFIPVVNPDGFTRRSRYSRGRVDPNRDYPRPDKPNRVSKVTCIKHLINFYHKYDFKGSMDIHASGKMVMFPWGYTKEEISSADFNFMSKLTQEMAKENKYRHGPISKVIYVAKGSSADYYYWKNGGIALAIELTTSKAPSAKRIPAVVDEAREMTWKFIESF